MLRTLPLLAGLLPVLAVNASYVIAAVVGRVPLCFPYLQGCTSISATGRYPPSSFLFKAVMLPEAVLLALYWILSVAWLRTLDRGAGGPGRAGTATAAVGVSGAVFLVLYVTFLGSQEPFYEFMRRFGIYLYFLLTIVAQIMLARAVLALPNGDDRLRRVTRLQLALALVPFGMGVLNLVLKATLADPDPAENVIEWLVALMMQVYVALSYAAWRHTDFRASFTASGPPNGPAQNS